MTFRSGITVIDRTEVPANRCGIALSALYRAFSLRYIYRNHETTQ
jgi:hypothetical protein